MLSSLLHPAGIELEHAALLVVAVPFEGGSNVDIFLLERVPQNRLQWLSIIGIG
jgi:hypothetical protein